jgi:hypothetical protein
MKEKSARLKVSLQVSEKPSTGEGASTTLLP